MFAFLLPTRPAPCGQERDKQRKNSNHGHYWSLQASSQSHCLLGFVPCPARIENLTVGCFAQCSIGCLLSAYDVFAKKFTWLSIFAKMYVPSFHCKYTNRSKKCMTRSRFNGHDYCFKVLGSRWVWLCNNSSGLPIWSHSCSSLVLLAALLPLFSGSVLRLKVFLARLISIGLKDDALEGSKLLEEIELRLSKDNFPTFPRIAIAAASREKSEAADGKDDRLGSTI